MIRKPRIKPYPSIGGWCCTDGDSYGYATTITGAWWSWVIDRGKRHPAYAL